VADTPAALGPPPVAVGTSGRGELAAGRMVASVAGGVAGVGGAGVREHAAAKSRSAAGNGRRRVFGERIVSSFAATRRPCLQHPWPRRQGKEDA